MHRLLQSSMYGSLIFYKQLMKSDFRVGQPNETNKLEKKKKKKFSHIFPKEIHNPLSVLWFLHIRKILSALEKYSRFESVALHCSVHVHPLLRFFSHNKGSLSFLFAGGFTVEVTSWVTWLTLFRQKNLLLPPPSLVCR